MNTLYVLLLAVLVLVPWGYILIQRLQQQQRQHYNTNPPSSDIPLKTFKSEDWEKYSRATKRFRSSSAGDDVKQQCRNSKPLEWDAFTRDVLVQSSIYGQFNVADYTFDNGGWTNIGETFSQLLVNFSREESVTDGAPQKPIRVIEVGSFKGRSTIAMAQECRKLELANNRSCSILAIDTWTGSGDMFFIVPGFRDELKRNGGILHLYETFIKNVKKAEVDDIITPLRVPSSSAGLLLRCFELKADLIFVDGDHHYMAVRSDMDMLYEFLNPGGFMFGDDYSPSWVGVVKAVDEFVAHHGLTLHRSAPTWIVQKPRPTQLP